jgi:LemA protein
MSGSLLIWIGLALIIFWCVGLYNRLMRMRARGLDALGSVAKYLRQYIRMVDAHLSEPGAARPAWDGESAGDGLWGDWEPLVKQLHGLDVALNDLHAAPFDTPPLGRLTEVLGGLQSVWQSLCDQPADLAGPVVPEVLRFQWDANTAKVQSARGGFNQIMNKYNEAIAQFPARLVVGMLRFSRAGQL